MAPFWPLKPWFPDFLELLIDVPVLLPMRRNLLRQPHFHHFHRNLSTLHMTAFRIASDWRAISDSLLEWCASLPSAADLPLVRTTKLVGSPTARGVGARVILFLVLLFQKSLIFFFTFTVLSTFHTPLSRPIALCLALSFASLFPTFLLTLCSTICCAPFALSAPCLPRMFLCGIC